MSTITAPLHINRTEVFPLLAKAPITEAIIQVRGRATVPWEESVTLPKLRASLPDYPRCESQRTQEFHFGLGQDFSIPVKDAGWTGGVFRTSNQKQVAHFARDSFSLSRLAPYESWDAFSAEALRLYAIHLKNAAPAEAQRIGLRFVNQFDVPDAITDLGEYFTQPPVTNPGLPLMRELFFHQDTFQVPGHLYNVTVIRTIQPAIAQEGLRIPAKLIFDIDVFTRTVGNADPSEVQARLSEMRWLKNKVFFSGLTATAVASFK